MSTNEPQEQGQPGEEAGAPEEPRLSERKAPLRGTGRAIGMSGEGGGAAELMKRVRDAANAARQAAEEHRPAAERTVREAADRAKRAAEAALPEAERLARQARAAADAARPHVERAAHEAAVYAREHEDELRDAASKAARFVAPAALRTALDAMEAERQRKPAPVEDEDTPPKS
jgi:hypothetical protein